MTPTEQLEQYSTEESLSEIKAEGFLAIACPSQQHGHKNFKVPVSQGDAIMAMIQEQTGMGKWGFLGGPGVSGSESVVQMFPQDEGGIASLRSRLSRAETLTFGNGLIGGEKKCLHTL